MIRRHIEDYPQHKPEYLFDPFVAFGEPSVLQGQSGVGKTTIVAFVMAGISRGIYPPRLRGGSIKRRAELTEWQIEAIKYMNTGPTDEVVDLADVEPVLINGVEVDGIDDEDDEIDYADVPPMDKPFYRPVRDPIKMVYITRENHYGNIIRKKYEEFGGREGYLIVIDESDSPFTTSIENIREATGDAKLVVVDPIFPFMEGRMSSNEDVAKAMHNFEVVARETGAAFILMNNLTKGGGSADIDAGLGASNLKNIARSLFKLDRDGNKLYLESVKNNNSAARGRIGVLFDRLGRPDFINYRQLEDAEKELFPQEEKKRYGPKTQEALDFLEELLVSGPKLHSEVKEKAKERGIAKRTLDEAKKIRNKRGELVNGQSYWC